MEYLSKGQKVKFKCNRKFKPLDETVIAAVGVHEMVLYYIEHEDGEKTKASIKYNGGFPDGFETPHSKNFEEGKKYTCVIPEEVEKI